VYTGYHHLSIEEQRYEPGYLTGLKVASIRRPNVERNSPPTYTQKGYFFPI